MMSQVLAVMTAASLAQVNPVVVADGVIMPQNPVPQIEQGAINKDHSRKGPLTAFALPEGGIDDPMAPVAGLEDMPFDPNAIEPAAGVTEQGGGVNMKQRLAPFKMPEPPMNKVYNADPS